MFLPESCPKCGSQYHRDHWGDLCCYACGFTWGDREFEDGVRARARYWRTGTAPQAPRVTKDTVLPMLAADLDYESPEDRQERMDLRNGAIRAAARRGEGRAEIAMAFGVTERTVYRVLTRSARRRA